ncbi:hypothetical protein V6U90_01550 [Micromonospora sp. CPCC 206060]|uniref:hypothetical protein n=1 Tax=Micromonospora sp. CPCC 206060 TaxID=3122406 RepID=UPI002FEFCBE4
MTTISGTTAARLAALSTVVALGAGCGVLDTVQNAVDTANALGGFADRLGRAATLTYTAQYTVTGGADGTVTIVQAPPNSALVHGDDRIISTPQSLILCDGADCQAAPNAAASAATADATLVAGVAGAGFVTPELALGLVAAAAIIPSSDVSTSERTIAGQPSLCADVTGIEDPQGGTGELVEDFSVCVTEAGVLASFSGRLNTGEEAAIELAEFSAEADPTAFAPPADATVTDVTRLAG